MSLLSPTFIFFIRNLLYKKGKLKSLKIKKTPKKFMRLIVLICLTIENFQPGPIQKQEIYIYVYFYILVHKLNLQYIIFLRDHLKKKKPAKIVTSCKKVGGGYIQIII